MVLFVSLAAAALIGRLALRGKITESSNSSAAAPSHVTGPLSLRRGAPPSGSSPKPLRRVRQPTSAPAKGGPNDESRPAHRAHTSLTSVSPPPLPSGAATVAAGYARATYTWSTGETPAGWLSSLASFSAPVWLAHLASADPSAPVTSTSVSIGSVFSAHAPAGEVGADVLVTLHPGGPRALLVDLVQGPTGWSVAGAS